MKKSSIIKIGVVLSLLVASSLACSFSQNLNSSPTQAPEGNTAPKATETAKPTQPAAAPTEAPTAGQKPNGYYEGISFYYDPALAKGVLAQTRETSAAASNDAPFFAVHPKEYTFDFQGYMIADGLKPQILVFSPKDYGQLATDYGDANPVTKEVERLHKLLADQPADSSGRLPFLMPEWNAGESFHAHLKYLSFQNGKGIRYLAEFGQSPTPLSNKLLCYVFQGITDDGADYISAILPVNHAPLPGDNGEELAKNDFSKFMENYPSYIVDIHNKLNGENEDTFDPKLGQLDALFTSLKIDK